MKLLLLFFLLGGTDAPVYYDASTPLDEGSACRTAIILIHGWNGGLKPNGTISLLESELSDTYVLCPSFPTHLALEKAGMEPDGRALWNASWTRDLKVRGSGDDDWRGGGDAAGMRLSSFDVVDMILAKLSDRKLFPNLEKVVLSGFSAGGQFVSRYIAVGKGRVRKGITLKYAAMSPSTHFRFDPGTAWHYGLADRPRYCRKLSEKRMMKNLSSRTVFCGCGDKDVAGRALDATPEAMSQGVNRYDRYLNFIRHTEQWPEWNRNLTFHTFEGIAHEASKAYSDPVLLNYLKK